MTLVRRHRRIPRNVEPPRVVVSPAVAADARARTGGERDGRGRQLERERRGEQVGAAVLEPDAERRGQFRRAAREIEIPGCRRAPRPRERDAVDDLAAAEQQPTGGRPPPGEQTMFAQTCMP